jgi:hypothetical protein
VNPNQKKETPHMAWSNMKPSLYDVRIMLWDMPSASWIKDNLSRWAFICNHHYNIKAHIKQVIADGSSNPSLIKAGAVMQMASV